MIAALDTNVLLDILLPDEHFAERSTAIIERASAAGSLVICDTVYAELCVHFETQRECDRFLSEAELRVEPLGSEALFAASRAWRLYRRRGGRRTRILSDFLIGAHAQVHASCLITRDRGFYRDGFPSLIIIDPAQD